MEVSTIAIRIYKLEKQKCIINRKDLYKGCQSSHFEAKFTEFGLFMVEIEEFEYLLRNLSFLKSHHN